MRISKHAKLVGSSPSRRGFTLVEATAAILIALALAGIGVALVGQQVWFQQFITNQRFIAEDGPTACNLLSRTMNKADRFLIYGSVDDARSNTTPVLVDGDAVIMSFVNPDGVTRSLALIGEEDDNGTTVLNYYHQDGSGWAANPSWTITRNVDDVNFSVVNGVLIATLTGPNGGIIRLGGSSQL